MKLNYEKNKERLEKKERKKERKEVIHSKKEREAPTSLRLWLSNTHTQKKENKKKKKNDRVFIGLYATIDSANNSECKRKASMTKVYFSFFLLNKSSKNVIYI